MLDASAKNPHHAATGGPPLDFQEHLRLLDAHGLVTRIDRPIDKDRELHPLVRWQFQGGLAEDRETVMHRCGLECEDGVAQSVRRRAHAAPIPLPWREPSPPGGLRADTAANGHGFPVGASRRSPIPSATVLTATVRVASPGPKVAVPDVPA